MNMHAASCAEDSCEAIHFQTAGSYTINGRHEFPCSTVGTTRAGLELRVMVKPRIGDRVDAIFDTIGHLQGFVCDLTLAGAVVALDPGLHAALNEQFAFLAQASVRDVQRRHFRIKPRRPETTIRAANRLPYKARSRSVNSSSPNAI